MVELPEEEIGKVEQRLIGPEDTFGLSEDDVLGIIEEVRKDCDSFREALEDPHEKFRDFATRALPRKELELQVLTELPPAELIVKLKTCYDRLVELIDTNVSRKEVIKRIMEEFPNIMRSNQFFLINYFF